jgi:hypothetical protein
MAIFPLQNEKQPLQTHDRIFYTHQAHLQELLLPESGNYSKELV